MTGDAGALLGLLFEHSPVPQFVSRADGSLVLANPAFWELLGTSPSAGPMRPADVTHPDDLPHLLELGARLLRGELDVIELEVRVRNAEGEMRWCAATSSLAHDGSDEPLIVSHLVDISARKRAEAELALSQSQYRLLADSLPVGVQRRDTKGRLLYVNQRWSEITGLAEDEALGQDHVELIHPDDRARLLDASLRLAREGGHYHEEYRIVRPDGGVRWVSSRSVPLPGPDGRPVSFVGSLEDITELRAAHEEVGRLAAIADATSDLVGIVDDRGWVVYANRAARDAYDLAQYDGPVHSTKLYTPESIERFFSAVLPRLSEGRRWSGVLDMYGVGQEVRRIWQAMAPHLGPDGALQHISAVGRDVTEQQRLEAELTHRATHDVLTGLPNRALLLDELGRAVGADLATSGPVAVLFIDLDRFKAVNDELGHDVGDELLRVVSARLASVLRPVDVVARLGGDEFVVVCPDLGGREHAEEVATRLLRAVSGTPIHIDGREIAITASVGISLSSGDEDDHAEGLLRDADAAMYQAKQRGRARFELYDPDSI